MPRKIEDQKESAQKAKKLELLQKLYSSPYRDRKDRNPERVDGTCEWFTNNLSFRSWQESKISSLLWVSADPGCGKSVLAKYLVDAVLPSTKLRTTCYFFFKDDFEDQKSAVSALCCILHQLFIQNDALFSNKILERFEADGEKLIGSFRDLWDILISAANSYNAGEIICILDALDECEDEGRSQIAGALNKLYWTGKSKFVLKFLLTSRPYIYIQQDFQSLKSRLPTIHLSGENKVKEISQEINIFIKSRVEDIGANLQLLPEEQQLLKDELIRVPNRTYL
jgi:ankyrin repeat domain-containing protein 50